MKLKIDDLYPLQNILDSRIFTLHHVTRTSTRDARILALLIEVGEMINETRCFKYWSEKPASEKAIILEEYGDGIHFLLSLGIDLEDDSKELSSEDTKEDLLHQALDVYEQVSILRNDFTLKQYYKTL